MDGLARMSEAFVPYEPLDQLKPVADHIWIVDGHEVRMRTLGVGIPFPTRMTVVRLPDGALWIHSPVAADEALYAAVAKLGPVAHLVAPNTLHWSFIADWRHRFPTATVHIVPGLEARVAEHRRIIDDAAEPAWADAIVQRVVRSRLLTEAVFFHRPSETLILADLIENFEPERVRSRFWRGAMRLAGAADPDGKAPIDMQLSFLGRRKQLRTIVRQMIAWAPRRVILSHGRWYAEDGVVELRRAFRWVL
jgi:hypothetical protein